MIKRNLKGIVIVTISTLSAFILSIVLKNILLVLTTPTAYSPIQNSSDFAMSDIFEYISNDANFSYISNDIVIVATDGCNRQEIASIIDTINTYNPKVIGLDVIFKQQQYNDSALISTINKCNQIVLPYDMGYNTQSDVFFVQDSSYFYNDLKHVNLGAINLSGNSIRNVIRRFKNHFCTQTDSVNSFSYLIANLYSNDNTNKLNERPDDGLIAYRGREIEKFTKEEFISLEDKNLTIQNKIVLLGDINSNSDMHTTPIKEEVAGVVIHAHIIDTILNGLYIKEASNLLNYSIAILMTLLFCGFTYYVRVNVKYAGRLLIRTVQFGLIITYIIIGYFLYSVCNYYINFSISVLMTGISILMLDITSGFHGLYTLMTKKIAK